MKYKVLNMLQTFRSVVEIILFDMPFKGILKSILYGWTLAWESSLPLSRLICSYSSRIGKPSTTSNSFTICFLNLSLYYILFVELMIFCSSLSLLICNPLTSTLYILILTL
jgi:hypothetical protein